MSYGGWLASSVTTLASGEVDYRLAREAVIRDYHRGRISRLDICDAQPELLRAARNLGERTAVDCPICKKAKVVLVSYAFGPRMPPSGRCLSSPADWERLADNRYPLVCYVVEVCPSCAWNHLSRMLMIGGPRGTSG